MSPVDCQILTPNPSINYINYLNFPCKMLILFCTSIFFSRIFSPRLSEGLYFLSKVPQILHTKKADFVSAILIQHLSQKCHLCSPSQSTFAFPSKMSILSLRKLPQILASNHPLIISGFPPKVFPIDYPSFTSVPY